LILAKFVSTNGRAVIVDRRPPVSDILIECPIRKTPVATGLTTGMIVLETLPPVALPLHCPACGNVHYWLPKDAWQAVALKLVHSQGG